MLPTDVLVLGAGIFGVTAARELHDRGYRVRLIDAGTVPNPLAASTDISKVCRLEYGSDGARMADMEHARAGWIEWNAAFGEELFCETGVLIATAAAMEFGGFEAESWAMLRERGHTPERVRSEDWGRRFPAWRAGCFRDGFFHAKGGFARSARTVEVLVRELRRRGVDVQENRPIARLLQCDGRTVGAVDASGAELRADAVVLAAGSWTQKLCADLAPSLQATAHPIFHLRPRDPELFQADRFPVFTADIARTGFYGFPLERGVVKLALHAGGILLDRQSAAPEPAGEVLAAQVDTLRGFLAENLPALADAELVATRLCPYSETRDADFWISRSPGDEGLCVAAGGSGHAFKFAPLLGAWIADALEGRGNSGSARIRWRSDSQASGQGDEARYRSRTQ